MGSETKNDCAGEVQQQFTGLDGVSVSLAQSRELQVISDNSWLAVRNLRCY
jgi:hypothetical protein